MSIIVNDVFDVFDDMLTSKGFAVVASQSDVKIDYIQKEKSNITLNKRYTGLEINDLLVDRGTRQVWRIADIQDEIKLIVYSNFDTIDFPYFIENAVITSTDLEQEIADIILNYWTSNVDPLIYLPMTISTPTTTNGELRFFGKEDSSLRRILERAINKYQISCVVRFDGIQLDITIQSQATNSFEFRIVDSLEYNLDITDVAFNTLELVSRDLSNVVVSENYYLLTDNTVTTDETDVNRDTPVLPKLKYVDFDDFTIESARQELQGQLSNNEITVTFSLENNPLNDMELGDKVLIYTEDNDIQSQLTAISQTSTEQVVRYIFGIGRNRLTDKLKKREE